ncbi:enoyl-CoA hydratase/isomerase family protein [Rhodococcoides yunnanense]|uniref:enoyl-CoA hydratase/isomerase family protein n=1 Tax=Rhodococcoides yunnanense TaxID=278209 RepID=UPI0009340D49|nr:enoyl-CoA hydratase-related protein [Rhodococcus yunnanensis]
MRKSDTAPVTRTISHGIAVLTLDNPPVNAMTQAATRELNAQLRDCVARDDVRVVVITGAGNRAFCAGSDISEMPQMQRERSVVARKTAFENAAMDYLADLPLPTIAAINGVCLGGGLELAMCCDFLVAEEGGLLGLPEVDLGLIPSSGGPMRAIRRLGLTRAAELVLLGEPITAQTALAWGLVNRLAPRGTALQAALGLAETLAAKSGSALRLNKQALARAFGAEPNLPAQQSVPLFEESFESADGSEGVRAFLAKETPDFEGRPR